MDEPEGERMTSPMPFSQVETNYKNGDAEIDVKIVDTGFAQMLIAPWSMMLASGYSRETSERLREGDDRLRAIPRIEKWDKERKNGELNVLVGKRFIVDDRRPRHRRHEAAPRASRRSSISAQDRGREIAG